MEKELIKKAYDMGYESFPKFNSAPYDNKNFIDSLPKCQFGDTEGVKLRIRMYKSYIKGWTQAHLDQEWNLE